MHAMYAVDPTDAIRTVSSEIAHQHTFNTKIPFEGSPITSQKASGRCWLFAATNVFRVPIMKKYKLESFELSQKYLYYYDKVEKANWFLEQIIDTASEGADSRVVTCLVADMMGDGGQWDMVHNLVSKYGLVPQSLYPDNWSAKNSRVMRGILQTRLREFAWTLRKILNSDDETAKANIGQEKTRMMEEIQKLVTLMLGAPPNPTEAFSWQFLDKEGTAQDISISPKELATSISTLEPPIAIQGMVSLVNDPRNPPLTHLTVSRLGNVVGGKDVTYINVDMDTFKDGCIKMLKEGRPIFFGCDFGKFREKNSGVMSMDCFDYEAGLGCTLNEMNKEQRLLMGESLMTHAMVLTAVHLDEQTGRPIRWKVQNSHGTESAAKGWYVMTDDWMDEFVYQAVVDVEFLNDEVKAVLQQQPVVLPLWDPMGSLA